MSEEEVRQVLADRDWWREVAALIGGHLHSFTYRNKALISRGEDGRQVDLPGWVAKRILELASNKSIIPAQPKND